MFFTAETIPSSFGSEESFNFRAGDLTELIARKDPDDLPALKPFRVADIPNTPYVLRYGSGNDLTPIRSDDPDVIAGKATEAIKTFDAILGRLATTGIAIVPHIHFLVRNDPYIAEPRVYTVAKRIGQGITLQRAIEDDPENPQLIAIAKRTAADLIRFYEAPASKNVPLPVDIDRMEQYAANGTLLDIEALKHASESRRVRSIQNISAWENNWS